ncbi:MAG: hypothetical protein ABIQ01_12050 [Pseudolysinimonas sp.]
MTDDIREGDIISPDAQRVATQRVMELYTAAARSPMGGAEEAAFQRAFYAMPFWLFIPVGPIDSPQPYALVVGGKPSILGYLDDEYLRSEAIAGGIPPEEAGKVLAVPPRGVVDWSADWMAAGVVDIRFQLQRGEYVLPLARIAETARLAGLE